MKLAYVLLILLGFTSCSDDQLEIPITTTPAPLPYQNSFNIPIVFVDHSLNTSTNYNAVRIGEYLWMDSNINHYEGKPFSKKDINLILTRYRIDTTLLKDVSAAEVNRYCGPYYDRERFEYLEDRNKRSIYEGTNKVLANDWGAPSSNDVRQLFAMCGNGTEQDVRTTLTVKAGANPIAKSNLTYWFGPNNTNKYGFNLMPSGARFNGAQVWKLNHTLTEIEYINVATGDFYGFVQAVVLPTWNGRAYIDDYPHADGTKSWHWMPIRWCRKLTDKELGYKLFINQEQNNIIKLSNDSSAPSGYTELPNGYIRGFYVQFILDNPNPQKTVLQIVAMTKTLL